MNNIISQKTVIALIVLVALVLLVGLINPKAPVESPKEVSQELKAPYLVTMTGKMVCLPHKNADGGPTTAECAYGLQTPDGLYYALDFTNAEAPNEAMSENNVTIVGLYTPLSEMVPTARWDVYDIHGAISVSEASVTAQ